MTFRRCRAVRSAMRAAITALAAAMALAVAGCGDAHTAPPTTTAPSVTPSTHEIALARSSNGLLSIFPAKPGEKTCAIPEGGIHFQPLRGTCSTSIRWADTHEPELTVTFTEKWPRCLPADDCVAGGTLHHTWQVVEGATMVTASSPLHVLATRQSGATAPQYYK
ncbi:MAG: hypothetical protein QOG85_2384 [Gaiellaceae bacterium]|nr:hypothetical protein [Gaiellaceae bacterium]